MLRWLWNHRIAILNSCLNERAACGAPGEIEKVMAEVRAALPTSQTEHLVFVRETDRPDLFKSADGDVHRIAATGGSPGSKIHFNRDRLPGLSLETLCAILFHEFTHHTGRSDDERRLPDHVGSIIGRHLSQKMMSASLDEANAENVRVGIFQFSFKEQYLENDFKNPSTNFAFLTDGHTLIDFDLSAFMTYSACDNKDQIMVAQKNEPPTWTVVSQEGQNYDVHLRSKIVNFCSIPKIGAQKEASSNYRTFKLAMKIENGRLRERSLVTYLSPWAPDDVIDQLKTVKLVDHSLSKTNIESGDSVTFTATLKPLKPIQAKECIMTFHRVGAPKQKDEWPVLSSFKSCRIDKVENGLIHVSGELQTAPLMRAGTYRLFLLQLKGEAEPALVRFPEKASFELRSSAADEPRIESLGFNGLRPLTAVGAQKLNSSYQYSIDQEFDLEVTVASRSTPLRESISFGIAVQVGQGLKMGHFSGETKDLAFIVLGRKVDKVTSGYKITYRLKVPRKMQQANVFGVQIERLLIEDQSLNWFEMTSPEWTHMVFMDRFVEINP